MIFKIVCDNRFSLNTAIDIEMKLYWRSFWNTQIRLVKMFWINIVILNVNCNRLTFIIWLAGKVCVVFIIPNNYSKSSTILFCAHDVLFTQLPVALFKVLVAYFFYSQKQVKSKYTSTIDLKSTVTKLISGKSN